MAPCRPIPPPRPASCNTRQLKTAPSWAAMTPGPGRWRAAWPAGFTPLVFRSWQPAQAGAYLYGEAIYLQQTADGEPAFVIHTQEIALRGAHNLLNVMAACAIAAAAGLPVEAMRAGVRGFAGVPHRLEFVRSWGGADWYNDSIATAPERAMAAIRSFDEPLVLLAGGRDKNLPWDAVCGPGAPAGRSLIVFGEAAEIILRAYPAWTCRRKPRPCKSVIRCQACMRRCRRRLAWFSPEMWCCCRLVERVLMSSRILRSEDYVSHSG